MSRPCRRVGSSKTRSPASSCPPPRITDFDQIAGKVALNTLAANQVLVEGMFVDPTTNSIGFGRRLEENHVAYTISVDSTSGVAGLLVPGDLVDIFATTGEAEVTDAAPSDTAEQQGIFGQNARLLYHQVRILAIGTETAPQPGEEQAAAEGRGRGRRAAAGQRPAHPRSSRSTPPSCIASVDAGALRPGPDRAGTTRPSRSRRSTSTTWPSCRARRRPDPLGRSPPTGPTAPSNRPPPIRPTLRSLSHEQPVL